MDNIVKSLYFTQFCKIWFLNYLFFLVGEQIIQQLWKKIFYNTFASQDFTLIIINS